MHSEHVADHCDGFEFRRCVVVIDYADWALNPGFIEIIVGENSACQLDHHAFLFDGLVVLF